MQAVYICGAVRTPIGALGGGLSSLLPRPLATITMQSLLEHAKCSPSLIEYTTLGWVAQDCRSPNPAKSAAEFAGVPHTSPGTTLHENCASGGAAVHALARMIALGEVQIGIAGGVESMSNVPRYLFSPRGKALPAYGDVPLVDGLMDALTDKNVGPKGELMGLLTERLVAKYNVTREEQDEVAFRSHHNAVKTWESGMFDYVLKVNVPNAKRGAAPVVCSKDEGPRAVTREELAAAKPHFQPNGGTITTLNSSSINDGAAMLLLASERAAKEHGLTILAELRAYRNVGVPRDLMGEGAFHVLPTLLKCAKMALSDVHYLELNEAFAAVVAAGYHHLPALKPECVNQWGSGISLGHPVGATGARQIVDMVHQLKKRNATVGITTRCVGGGIGSGEVIVNM